MLEEGKARTFHHPPRRLLRFVPFLDVLNLAPGEFPSLFKGEGQEFVDFRPYQPGDSIKRIHWSGFAKTGALHTVERNIPKSLSIFIALDVSSSMFFGKKQEIVDMFLDTLIASLAWRGNNSIEFQAFSGKLEKRISPRPGKINFIAMQKWRLNYQAGIQRKTDIARFLHLIVRQARLRTVMFLISDFLDERDFGQELKLAVERLDFIPVIIQDPREFEMPSGFRTTFQAMEERQRRDIFLSANTIQELKEWRGLHTEKLLAMLKQYKVEPIFLESDRELHIFGEISRFLRERKKRKNRRR